MTDPQRNPPAANPDDHAPTREPHGGSTGERLHERGGGPQGGSSNPGDRQAGRENENQDERQGNLGGGNQGDR